MSSFLPTYELWVRCAGGPPMLEHSTRFRSEAGDYAMNLCDVPEWEMVVIRVPPPGELEWEDEHSQRRIILRGGTEGEPRLTVEDCQ